MLGEAWQETAIVYSRAPKGPFWVRPSCNAFLSGKSWQYFVAVHPPEGALQGGERHHKYGAAFGGVERGYRAIETLYNFLHNG